MNYKELAEMFFDQTNCVTGLFSRDCADFFGVKMTGKADCMSR